MKSEIFPGLFSARHLILREIHYFLSATLVVCIILESVFPNIILAYFNLNYLVACWILAGIINIVCTRARK